MLAKALFGFAIVILQMAALWASVTGLEASRFDETESGGDAAIDFNPVSLVDHGEATDGDAATPEAVRFAHFLDGEDANLVAASGCEGMVWDVHCIGHLLSLLLGGPAGLADDVTITSGLGL